MPRPEDWLLNLLLYRPGHNGFSRYVQRVVPALPGRRLWLGAEPAPQSPHGAGEPIPERFHLSPALQSLQQLTLAQHGLPLRRRLRALGWSDVRAVYSPYPDYLFALGSLPQILTCHDLTPLHLPSSRRAHWRYRLWTPQHLQRAHRLIAISRFVADQLMDLGMPASRLVVIANGIALPSTAVQAPGSHDWLLLARHDRNKNLAQAIQAFAGFLQRRRDWPGLLRIIGRDGRTTAQLQRLVAELGLQGRVQLLASVPEPELQRLLASAFALVSTSLMEGFDYPVLEAKALGVPTLISAIPVHLELHQGSSLLFASGDDPQGLQDAMLQLADDPRLWAQLSQAGRACAEALSLERQVAAIRTLMDDVLS